jgi:hypothetical protein
MIRLGLRLTLNGGREAVVRLVIIAAAVALGVAMLLVTLAGLNAVNKQNDKYAWLETGLGTSASVARQGPDELRWVLGGDYFHGTIIGRVDVAATGPAAPVPPGIPRLPGPGQYYASPALVSLLRTVPRDQLADRFPGTLAGVIGPAALSAPNSLLIVVGRTVAQLADQHGNWVTRIQTQPPDTCADCLIGVGIDANGLDIILAVVVAALLFPVLILVSTATRLSAARREQRFAAMRLVGATPRQISVIASIESFVAALGGTLLGFALFYAVRDPLAAVPFTGAPFYPGYLTLSVPDVLLAGLGIPLAAAVVSRLALRRVHVSALGVTRRVTPKPPRAWRLIPLLAGVAELALTGVVRPRGTSAQITMFLPGFLLIMAGLIISGSWLTMSAARFLGRHTRTAATLLASRRLADNPGASFRSISGLILALFVTSSAVGIVTTTDADGPSGSTGQVGAVSTLVDNMYPRGGPPAGSIPALPAGIMTRLTSVPGVTGVTVVHVNPADLDGAGGLVLCAQLPRTPAIGRCAPGAVTGAFAPGNPAVMGSSGRVWPAVAVPVRHLTALPVQNLVVATDGSMAAIEQARTVLDAAFPYLGPPTTIGETDASGARLTSAYQQLTSVVILASLVIAGCALAVSVVAGLNDRRRPFSLLRLAGAPLATLRRVVLTESAAPLLVVAALSIAAGFGAAALFLNAQLHEALRPPGPAYYGVVVAGLAVAIAVIAATFPLLTRITAPDVVRND